MPTTRKKQKNRREKKHDAPPPAIAPSTPQSTSPLEAFFADHAPQFQYDATVSAPWEFYRLCDELGWDRDDSERNEAHQKFKDAHVQQFNALYGTDVDDLHAWQNLCHVVRVDLIPDNLHACPDAVYYTFVNLVDLVDTHTTREEVHIFESERAPSEYTLSNKKFFPRENIHSGSLLRYLLRRIYYPRDGYDVSHRGSKRGRPRRR